MFTETLETLLTPALFPAAVDPPLLAAWIIGSYLVGGIPFGLLLGFAKGVDIRKHGSGNIGATNTIRILGKPIGITAFVLDFGKGLGPTLLALRPALPRRSVPLRSRTRCSLSAAAPRRSSVTAIPFTCASGGGRAWRPRRALCSHCAGTRL